MKEKRYEKKFSFGIDLDIELSDYKKIIDKYSPYISSVYFSLPSGDKFHTRNKMKEEYKKAGAKDKLLKILNLFRAANIKLEAVINQYNIEIEELKKALCDLDNFIKVDSICCLDEYVDIILEHYSNNIYLISSFNNNPLHKENINKLNNKYNMIVVGKEFMREPELLEKIKEQNFDVKLLINNGCAFNCGMCRSGRGNCIKTFENNKKRFYIEELYAMQSFFPWELDRLMNILGDKNIIDEIKISSRPSTYEYLNDCLESYIFNKGVKEYIEKDTYNYHLFGRQANLIPYFKEFNYDNIEKIKEELWN